jgi:hypothetical protein
MNLASKWDIVSRAYHTNAETEDLARLLHEFRATRIHDAACGTGFPVLDLAARGFPSCSASDAREDHTHLLALRKQERELQLPVQTARFTELAAHGIRDRDVVLCIGSSLTYCDSWTEDAVEVAPHNEGVLTALEALRSAMTPGGLLVLGNSKLYEKARADAQIRFPRVKAADTGWDVSWDLRFDWGRSLKMWRCNLLGDNGAHEHIAMASHLFDAAALLGWCDRLFGHTTFAQTSGANPEYYVLCSDSASVMSAAQNALSAAH